MSIQYLIAGDRINPGWQAIIPPTSGAHPTSYQPSQALPNGSKRQVPPQTPISVLKLQPNRLISPASDSSRRPSSSATSTAPSSTVANSTGSQSAIDLHLPPKLGIDKKGRVKDALASLVAERLDKLEVEDKRVVKEIHSEGPRQALDKYAQTYKPFWLLSLPGPSTFIPLPPSAPFPPPNYTLGSYTPYTPFAQLTDSVLARPPFSGIPVPLESARTTAEPSYYSTHFNALLSLHLSSQVEEANKSTLHSVPLHIQSVNANNLQGPHTIYRLQIPGVREDQPRLSNGDRLVLRGLYPDQRVGSNTAIEAEVIGLTKASGWVYVRAPDLVYVDASLPRQQVRLTVKEWVEEKVHAAMYRVEFKVSAAPVCAMQDAVRTFGRLLNSTDQLPSTTRPIARRWLFPDISDLPQTSFGHMNGVSEHMDEDETLNQEQRNAVRAVARDLNPRIPYLISGPPGTGKTKTLVATALQILVEQPQAVILLCAPSNPAADTLVQRLAKSVQGNDMLRLNPPSRTFAEVPGDVLRFCFIENDTFQIPSLKYLMRHKIVVTTCLDAAILVAAHVTNSDTMRAEYDLLTTLHPRGIRTGVVIEPHWTHLLVDEAGQGSEPETLIPMLVVLPADNVPEAILGQEPMVVLCGDVHQLGPIIPSHKAREAELDISLLERLFERSIYESHPKARSRQAKMLEQTLLDSYKPPFTNLCRNYRSIAPILMVPAALFYEDTLLPAAQNVNLIKWSGLGNPQIPILFKGCETQEDWIEEGASWYNAGEINMVAETIQSILTERREIRQEEIAVITPWREQVWRIRAKLRGLGLSGIDVGNVETYQGREFKITIISCVRSRSRFLEDDRRANMGLYNERKRFNVSITRAKELLVVIGNANLLKGDPYWNGFLQVMLRNGLYKGPEVDLELTGAYMSKLESKMRSEQDLSEDDEGMTLAGAIASAALGD